MDLNLEQFIHKWKFTDPSYNGMIWHWLCEVLTNWSLWGRRAIDDSFIDAGFLSGQRGEIYRCFWTGILSRDLSLLAITLFLAYLSQLRTASTFFRLIYTCENRGFSFLHKRVWDPRSGKRLLPRVKALLPSNFFC